MTNEMVIKTITMYEESLQGISAFSEAKVEIIGEQVVLYEGREIEQYIYNIEGYTPENGKPFAALKNNLIII